MKGRAHDFTRLRDPLCGDPELGCVVLVSDGALIHLDPAGETVVELFVHADGPSLPLVDDWRVNGVAATLAAIHEDDDGSDVTLHVPAELVVGLVVTLEAVLADDVVARFAFAASPRASRENTPVPSGCVCSTTYRKVYCPKSGGGWDAYCSNCCGF